MNNISSKISKMWDNYLFSLRPEIQKVSVDKFIELLKECTEKSSSYDEFLENWKKITTGKKVEVLPDKPIDLQICLWFKWIPYTSKLNSEIKMPKHRSIFEAVGGKRELITRS